MTTKQVIAFDLDDTLTDSKASLEPEMGALLGALLRTHDVCVISGGDFEQFREHLLAPLEARPVDLAARLHLMPSCGTRYYRFEVATGTWVAVYQEDLAPDEVETIVAALEQAARELGCWHEAPVGPVLIDRGGQVTFSALGVSAPAERRRSWDPDGARKQALRGRVAELLPDHEVRVGGTTSLDVTRRGIDKSHAMYRFLELRGVDRSDVLFVGDMLGEGGNDYPIKAMGIDTVEVAGWRETAALVRRILAGE